MANVLEVIFYAVVWFLIPAILFFLIWLIKSMANKAEDKKHRAAMRSGYWAGVMLFIIMLIYQISVFLKTGFPRNEIYQGFSLPLALGSALVIFILFLGKKVTPPVISGLLVLIFTFIAFSALVHYLFIRTYNDVLLSAILGGVFGFLTHFAASPTSLKEFLRGKSL